MKSRGEKGRGEKSRGAYNEPVEVWLLEPGAGRPSFSFEGALEYLPPDAPLPHVGDLVLLPRNVTGDSRKQSFAWGGKLTPFKVVEREHAYFREKSEKLNPVKVNPARYVRSMILVRRLTEEEYAADPQLLG